MSFSKTGLEAELPKVIGELRSWFLTMRGLEASALSIRKALDAPEPDREQLLAQTESLYTRASELNHQVGNRLTSWVLECGLSARGQSRG